MIRHGVMIGRAACINPMIFKHFSEYLSTGTSPSDEPPWSDTIKQDILSTCIHVFFYLHSTDNTLFSKYYTSDDKYAERYKENFYKYLGRNQQSIELVAG